MNFPRFLSRHLSINYPKPAILSVLWSDGGDWHRGTRKGAVTAAAGRRRLRLSSSRATCVHAFSLLHRPCRGKHGKCEVLRQPAVIVDEDRRVAIAASVGGGQRALSVFCLCFILRTNRDQVSFYHSRVWKNRASARNSLRDAKSRL